MKFLEVWNKSTHGTTKDAVITVANLQALAETWFNVGILVAADEARIARVVTKHLTKGDGAYELRDDGRETLNRLAEHLAGSEHTQKR